MKAMRAVSQQDVPWGRPQWWRREFDFRARGGLLARLFATAVSLFLPPEKNAWFARQFVPARQEIGQ